MLENVRSTFKILVGWSLCFLLLIFLKSNIFSIATIKGILNRRTYALSIYKEDLENLKHYNEELEKLLEEKQANVSKMQEQIQKLETELEEQEKKYLENMMKMDQYAWQSLNLIEFNNIVVHVLYRVRQLKELTETYINLQALPDHVQGMTLKDTVEGKEWEHFCISMAEHTEEEREGILTKLIQHQSAYKEQWHKLILGEVREDNQTS